MTVTRPRDKNKDRAQWWKDQPPPKGEIPDGPTANNQDNAGKKKFDEEMEPIKHPT